DSDAWRRLGAFHSQLGSALSEMAIAGVQHHRVSPFSCSHAAVAGSGRAVTAAVPLPHVHLERPGCALAQEEGADFIVIVAPKWQQTQRGLREPEH
ncbi:hypothetical protein N325_12797, partial [Colius striatus]